MIHFKAFYFALLWVFLNLPFGTSRLGGQTLDLETVIQLAKTQSVQAILARHQFMAGYWRFKSFKASYLPYVSLRTTPINFNRTITQRFNDAQNIDVYLPQRNIHSGANVSVFQNIGLTGGSIYLDSDLGRLQNFGNNAFTNYSVTPLRVGINQPLMGFNALRWEKQLEPLVYQLAKQQYIAQLESISLTVLGLFFEVANSQVMYELAYSDSATADTLRAIAQDRLAIGTITQDDVLELELRMVDAETSLERAKLELQKTRSELRVFLNLASDQLVQLLIPTQIPSIHLDTALIIHLAQTHHPDLLGAKQKELEADRELDKVQKENRFQANLNGSLGINQSAEKISTALGSLLDQEVVLLSINIPLLDWGRREGQVKMAQSNRRVTYAIAKQNRQDFKQEILIRLVELPILVNQVRHREKARQLADARYDITRQRFLLGNIDLIKLTSALQAQNQAQRQYLSALAEFWRGYYTLRYLSLYDIDKKQLLEVDFEALINQN